MADLGLATGGDEVVEDVTVVPGRVSRPGGGQRHRSEAKKALTVAESRVLGAVVVPAFARVVSRIDGLVGTLIPRVAEVALGLVRAGCHRGPLDSRIFVRAGGGVQCH